MDQIETTLRHVSGTLLVPIVEVTDAEMAFGTMKDLPDFDHIPDAFKSANNTYVQLFSHLFFHGPDGLEVDFAPGVDERLFARWMKAHMTSWGPRQEHKAAGIAYRLSSWVTKWSYNPQKDDSSVHQNA